MYRFPRPLAPQDVEWNRPRGPQNAQWRPFHQPRAAFRPRNQGYNTNRPPINGGNEDYWCETCDRGFPNEDTLNKHKQQHQKCNIDGCQFIAHPKVITKHIQMQHSSGLYKKIANLNNPEDIEKWREERKKRYPTKINIDKKAAELKEKIERGEKMNLGRKDWRNKRDDQNRDYNNTGQGMKRTFNNNNQQPAPKVRKPRKPFPKILPTPEENRSLAPFTGIQSLEMDSDEDTVEIMSNDGLIEDDDIAVENNAKIIKAHTDTAEKPVVCSALSSLMCEYGSSDEEVVDDQSTKPEDNHKISKLEAGIEKKQSKENTVKGDSSITNNTTTNKIDKEHNKVSLTNPANVNASVTENTKENNVESKSDKSMNARICDISGKINEAPNNVNILSKNNTNESNIEEDGDSGPEEVKVIKEDDIINEADKCNKTEKKNFKKKFEPLRKKQIYRKPKPRLPSTLIYKLLSKEMKQERNQVLQCIRYIRKNDYFDKSIT